MNQDNNIKLVAVPGHMLVAVEVNNKKSVTFESGLQLQIERGYNYNLREDNPSIGVIINGKEEMGTVVLIHHNATHASYKIFNEENEANGYELFSIPEDMIFLYMKDGSWFPFENFVISSRMYLPYHGNLVGMQPSIIKNRMYIHKGVNEGNVCVTTTNCDYEIIFFLHGKEKRIIRTRKREILGIDISMTEKLKKGELLLGLNAHSATKFNDYAGIDN